MLKIKLARFGKRKQPHYRIVVNEARDKRDGQYVALIGTYAPTQTPKHLEVNMEAYALWLTKGAQPTDTVASLIKRLETGTPFPEKKAQPSKKAKAKVAKQEENAAAAKVAEAEAKAAQAAEAEAAKTAEATPTVAAESVETTPTDTATPTA